MKIIRQKGDGREGGRGREAVCVVDKVHPRGQRPIVHQCHIFKVEQNKIQHFS